jgi:hypothetical protein
VIVTDVDISLVFCSAKKNNIRLNENYGAIVENSCSHKCMSNLAKEESMHKKATGKKSDEK